MEIHTYFCHYPISQHTCLSVERGSALVLPHRRESPDTGRSRRVSTIRGIGALGSALLAGADFAVSFGRLLNIALLAVLVLLIPMGWRRLSRQERAMRTAAVVAGIIVYLVTWSQSYAIQQWVLA